MSKLTLVLVESDVDNPFKTSSKMLDPFHDWEAVPCGCRFRRACRMCEERRYIYNVYGKYESARVGWPLPEEDATDDEDYGLTGVRLVRFKRQNEIMRSAFANDLCDVSEIPEDFMCSDVVTPDGEWHDITDAVLDEPTIEQSTRLKEIFRAYPDCIAVLWYLVD